MQLARHKSRRRICVGQPLLDAMLFQDMLSLYSPHLEYTFRFSQVVHVEQCQSLSSCNASAQNQPVTTTSNYWVANVKRQGTIPFGNASYPIFRNVMAYGAKGDGTTDDTAAINLAISYPGTRCGGGNAANGSFCQSQTTTPAMVYFPPGTYLVSAPLIMYYFTQLVGDAVSPPTIRVGANYKNVVGLAVFDADVYIPAGSGSQWYANQNNFYRQVRNFVVDMTKAPLNTAGVHWQVAQATSLQNIVFNMIPANVTNNQQQGIYMENGSGGFMSDLTFNGGAIGAFLGNQQFTATRMVFNGCGTAIYMNFDWLWTFQDITITNCAIGIDMTSGGFTNQAVGSVVVLDSVISATQGVVTPYAPGFSSPQSAGTLVLDNVDFTGSQIAIAVSGGTNARTVLAGGQYIQLFAQGNAWTTAGQAVNGQIFNGTTCTYANSSQTAYTAQETTIQRQLAPIPRPPNLVDSTGKYVGRAKPQYETVPASGFTSAKTFGLAGDGVTDDTLKMQQMFTAAGQSGNVVYFDHGAYLVSSTINIPPNVKITGECLPMIMATGSFFSDQTNPKPMWSVGTPGQLGTVEISDLVFETQGPAPGAIIIEWNIAANNASIQASAGIWDAHWRIGGSAGTQLQQNTCLKNPGVTTTLASTAPCQGAFLLLHVTPQANGYFENTWGWVADHELDMGTRDQIDIYNGRGALIESNHGPVWMYGTAFEHSAMYDYSFAGASNVYAGHIQHETAYYQGNPNALVPFTPNAKYSDPTFAGCTAANCARTWGLRVINSTNIFIYAAGLYNFFENWSTTACLASESCQEHMVDIQNSTEVYLWALSTKGSSYLISYEGNDVVPYAVNKANFCDTIVLFEISTTE